jgi:hypothetical protein
MFHGGTEVKRGTAMWRIFDEIFASHYRSASRFPEVSDFSYSPAAAFRISSMGGKCHFCASKTLQFGRKNHARGVLM